MPTQSNQPSLFEMQRAYEREQDRQKRQGPRHCSRCGARIVFLRVKKRDGTLGKPQPFDKAWKDADGQMTLAVFYEDPATGERFWRLEPRAEALHSNGEVRRGREPHFGTCPYA